MPPWSATNWAPDPNSRLKLATALLITIPGALLFFDFQRYLLRWASGGAVKGGRPGRASASPTRTHAKRAFPARSRPRRGAEALTVPRFRGTAEPVNGRGLVRSESISPARGHDGSSRWNVTTMAWMRGRSRRGGDTRVPRPARLPVGVALRSVPAPVSWSRLRHVLAPSTQNRRSVNKVAPSAGIGFGAPMPPTTSKVGSRCPLTGTGKSTITSTCTGRLLGSGSLVGTDIHRHIQQCSDLRGQTVIVPRRTLDAGHRGEQPST